MRFQPPPFYMLHPFCPPPKDCREDFLRFLIMHGVETPEEKAEFARLARAEVEKEWERHAEKAREHEARRRKEALEDLESKRQAIVDARRLGLWDAVLKREETFANIERTLESLPAGSNPGSWRGFIEGWGNDELNKYWRDQRKAKEAAKSPVLFVTPDEVVETTMDVQLVEGS